MSKSYKARFTDEIEDAHIEASQAAVHADGPSDWFKRSTPAPDIDWGPSLTRQDMADDCDINILMKKFENTGTIPQVQGTPTYIDWTRQPTTLADALEIMQAGDAAFMTLPARVRREFDNNPVEFMAFAEDPENLDQMREWGLAPPAELPDAPKEPPAAPAPSPGSSAQDASKAS